MLKEDVNCIIKTEKTAAGKEEEIYIKNTSQKLRAKIGDEFMVEYVGNLEWKIKPTANGIKIDLLYIE